MLAPDHLSDSFSGPRVIDWNRHSPNQDVTFIEYVVDPDPADTTMEAVFFFITNRAGSIEVQQDRHTFGLFSKATWLALLERGRLRRRIPGNRRLRRRHWRARIRGN